MLSRGTLQNIVNKLKQCSSDPRYRWTKYDANLYLTVIDEIKLITKNNNKKYATRINNK